MVSVGEAAPKLDLKLSDENQTNLSFKLEEAYQKGTTVLYFFPAAFTGVCTKSSCQIRDELMEFKEMDTQVFAISTDMPFTHHKFIVENELNFPLLSDWNKNAINAFNIRDDSFAGGLTGVSKRALFIIKEGLVTYRWVADTPGKYPPFDSLKDNLRQ